MNLYSELNKDYRNFKILEAEEKEKQVLKPLKDSEVEKEDEVIKESVVKSSPDNRHFKESVRDEDTLRGLEDELENTNDPEEKKAILKEIKELKEKILEEDAKTESVDVDPKATENDTAENTIKESDVVEEVTEEPVVEDTPTEESVEEVEVQEEVTAEPVVEDTQVEEVEQLTENEEVEEITEEIVEDEVLSPVEIVDGLLARFADEEQEAPTTEEIIETLNNLSSVLNEPAEEIEEVFEESDISSESDEDLIEYHNHLVSAVKYNEETGQWDDSLERLITVRDELESRGYDLDDNKFGTLDTELLEAVQSKKLTEFEVKSYKVTRVAPSVGVSLLEAETTQGIRYIVGKDYDEKNKTINETEIFESKEDATNHFVSLLGRK